MNQFSEFVGELKNLKIDSGVLLTQKVLKAIKDYSARIKTDNPAEWLRLLKEATGDLLLARPADPLLHNVVRFVLYSLENEENNEVAEMNRDLIAAIDYLLKYFEKIETKIVSEAIKIIKKGDNVLTHSHSTLLENIFKEANRHKDFSVFLTETRPHYQGRKLAEFLVGQKIKTTMIADSAASFLISNCYKEMPKIDKIILSADILLPNGWVLDETGAYGIAASAYAAGIPVYIVAELLRADEDGKIVFPTRTAEELWSTAPEGLKIINYMFDLIPAELITGIITEIGILKPKKLKKQIKREYPWLLLE